MSFDRVNGFDNSDDLQDVSLNKQFEFGGPITDVGTEKRPEYGYETEESRGEITAASGPTINTTGPDRTSRRDTSLVGTLIDALPVLAAFPAILLSADLAYVPHSYESVSSYVFALLVSSLLACSSLLMLSLLVKFNVVALKREISTSGSSQGLQSAILLAVGISFSYLATNFLPISRVSVLYLGLYLHRFNFCTPIFFFVDIYKAYTTHSYVSIFNICLGYVLVSVSFQILFKKFVASSVSNTVRNIRMNIFLPVTIALGLCLLFADASTISPSIIGVNIAASVVFIISLQETDLKSSKFIPSILSSIACALEFVVASKSLSIDSLITIFLPFIIVPDRSYDIANAYTMMSRSTSATENMTPILTELLSHSDTRAIFNFLLLNATFMFVQLLHSFRSKSLGLLSDSLHMALDCMSLALGLIAGALSKKEINPHGKYPFGLKNFEILAGFTNGTLLIGISGGIIFEAIGRLVNPVVLEKTTELIIVSLLGLGVNLVGIFAFNHGHAHGHSHGHSHSHGHNHEHESGHSHNHEHSHGEEHEDCKEEGGMNDNMKGIFLHILADTLGSVGVVVSTILTKYVKWNGFDPIASMIIATLILLSAIPLIQSTASSLLLRLTKKKETKVRNALNDITNIKGIKSFTTPRFWPNSSNTINGYIHIQVYRGENASYIKRQCERVFETEKIDVMIQVENDYDSCWCRSGSEITAQSNWS
ncbi:hypothetical protein G9P44_005131 [Scheffersomyces stipitis]|nr:hypothetical protein G9P44_005131 [Scheffersomyces stipitis]